MKVAALEKPEVERVLIAKHVSEERFVCGEVFQKYMHPNFVLEVSNSWFRLVSRRESAKLHRFPFLLAEVSRGKAPDDDLLVFE